MKEQVHKDSSAHTFTFFGDILHKFICTHLRLHMFIPVKIINPTETLNAVITKKSEEKLKCDFFFFVHCSECWPSGGQ